MRFLSVASLFGLLIAVAGCSSSSDLPAPKPNPWGTPDLKEAANKFHDKPSNRKTSGDQIPLKFTDSTGKEVDLSTYRGKSNVVLVVVKGMPQYPGGMFCPGCLAQVNSLTANYEAFQERDAEIVMVFPGPKDKLPDFLANGKVDGANGNPKVPFTLLLDQNLDAVKHLGILGDLAKPSTYILDKTGKAVYAFVGEGTYDRPSVKALLGQLDKLNEKK